MIVPATGTSGMYPDSPGHRPWELALNQLQSGLRNRLMHPVQCILASPVERGDESQRHLPQVHGPESMTADIPVHLQYLVDSQSANLQLWVRESPTLLKQLLLNFRTIEKGH